MRTSRLASILICSVVAGAHAEGFRVQGMVDMGGVGGNGDALFGDFADPGDPVNPVVPSAFGPTINGMDPIITGTMTIASFTGNYVKAGGADSILTPGGRDGVEIFRGGFGADYSLGGVIRVLIRDSDGDDLNIEFSSLNTDAVLVGFVHGPVGSDQVLSQAYQLKQYDAGFRSLWVEAIPAPGAAGVLVLAGMMGSRRRR